MLEAIGVGSIDELFADVPQEVRYPPLHLPPAASEAEVTAELMALAEQNADAQHYATFLGAGAYRHFIPAVVFHIINRGEFYTAYTPYQPEISQGTLQSIFEYQSMICALTGMDVANASHYDGATAMGEAALMAMNVTKGRRKIVVAPSVHPEYRDVLRTYTQGFDPIIVGDEQAYTTLPQLAHLIDEDTACVIVQNPDFFGRISDYQAVADTAHAVGALLVVVVNPISLGILTPPGSYGADIVVGEGQPLGWPLWFGGPYLGIFACREQYVRRMAGRLIGQTVDQHGRRGFVMTLQTREQHIRREKATSNICTNEALVALAACVYLSVMGKQGLRRVAELCYHKAHYAARQISALPGFSLAFPDAPFFHEFAVRCPQDPARINRALLQHRIIGGYEMGRRYPELKDTMLFCCTELTTK